MNEELNTKDVMAMMIAIAFKEETAAFCEIIDGIVSQTSNLMVNINMDLEEESDIIDAILSVLPNLYQLQKLKPIKC
jgi:hypothetical protein